MVVHAGVRDMRRHEFQSIAPAYFEELLVTCGIELQQSGTELKPLGPFCPPAAGVTAITCKNWGAFLQVPGLFQQQDFAPREFKKPFDRRHELLRRDLEINRKRHKRSQLPEMKSAVDVDDFASTERKSILSDRGNRF